MTTTRSRKTAAKATEPPKRILTLADLHVLTCDPCGATFTDPEMATFPADLKLRAYAAGWVIDGPWRVCPACAPHWHLDAPGGVVARITAQMAALGPDEAREMAAKAMLVHDEAPPATGGPGEMWACPACGDTFDQETGHDCTPPAQGEDASDEPGTVDPERSSALASMVRGYEAHGMTFPSPRYVLDSATGKLVPAPAPEPIGELDPGAKAHMAAFEAAHNEETSAAAPGGHPDHGPAAAEPERPRPGPGASPGPGTSPSERQDDEALDEADPLPAGDQKDSSEDGAQS
jgi:hypothetical protein